MTHKIAGMEEPYYRIEGGAPLRGEVKLSGAKNAATKLLVASMLTDEPCVIRNAPFGLGDLLITEDVAQALGAEIEHRDEHVALIRTPRMTTSEVPYALGSKNRLAILTAGPLLHRTHEAVIPAPGGDRIGPRPIDFHLNGLQQHGRDAEDARKRLPLHAPLACAARRSTCPSPASWPPRRC